MSEPDAVPLPREGEVFFDVRGDARSMRLSWYADSKIAVFSIWQGNRCTGTFRLPFADLARMIQTLQAGPQLAAPATGPATYQGLDYPDSGFGDSTDYGRGRDYGPPAYEHSYGAAHGQADYGGPGGGQAYRGYGSDHAPAPDRGHSEEYQGAFGRDQGIGANPGPAYSGRRRQDDQFADGPEYSAAHADPGHDPSWRYGPSQPHGPSQPYGEPYGQGQPYDPGQPYDSGQPYGSAQPYSPAQPYGPGQPHNPAQSYDSGAPYSSDQPYPPGQQYGATRQQHANYGQRDYEPPNYGGHGTGRDSDRSARSDGQPEAESAPETAMLGFPPVPARNGPYR